MPEYKYVLTPEVLAQSKNEQVLSLRNESKEFAWVKDKRMEVGWTDFIKDVARTMMLNHGKIGEEAIDLIKQIADQEYKEEDETQRLKDLSQPVMALLKLDPNNPEHRQQAEALLLHYSQAPMIFLGGPLNYFGMAERDTPYRLTPPGKADDEKYVSDLYLHKDQINLRVRINRLGIINPDKMGRDNKIALLGYLEGPAEAHFTLDLNKGFVLQEISTNNKYWADLYLKDNPEFFESLSRLDKAEERLESRNEALRKKLETASPDQASEIMLMKRNLEIILEALDEYRGMKINLETLLDRVRRHNVMIAEMDSVFSSTTVTPIYEVFFKLKPENNPQQRLQELTQLHSTYFQSRQNEILASRDPIPFHMNEAKGMMKIACESAINVCTEYVQKHPERYGSGMYSMMWGPSEQAQARKLAKAADAVFPDKEKSSDTPELDLLRNYLKFVKTLDEVVGDLDSEGKLFAAIESNKLIPVSLRSLGILLWQRLDDETVSKIGSSLKEHLDWMESILPERQLMVKGKIQ